MSSTSGPMNKLSTTAVTGLAPRDHDAFNERFVDRGIEYQTDSGDFAFAAEAGDTFTETGEVDGVGASEVEPLPVLEGSYLRMNIDIGNQSNGGEQAAVLGNIANSRPCEQSPRWELKSFPAQSVPAPVTASPDGRVWLLFGADSSESGRQWDLAQGIEHAIDALGAGPRLELLSQVVGSVFAVHGKLNGENDRLKISPLQEPRFVRVEACVYETPAPLGVGVQICQSRFDVGSGCPRPLKEQVPLADHRVAVVVRGCCVGGLRLLRRYGQRPEKTHQQDPVPHYYPLMLVDDEFTSTGTALSEPSQAACDNV